MFKAVFVKLGLLAFVLSGVASATAQTGEIEISKKHPDFGGAYVTQDGVLRICRQNPSFATDTQVEATVLSELKAQNKYRAQTVKCDYSFTQLAQARDTANQLFSVPGVTLNHIDAAKSRVVVGIANESAREAVAAAVARLGLQQIVTIEVMPPIHDVLALTDALRPPYNGAQILRRTGPTSASLCTLGFSATYPGNNPSEDVPVFVTNSHCSEVNGETEPSEWHQGPAALSTFVPERLLGTEVFDPETFECDLGKRCRYSDATLAYRYMDLIVGVIYGTPGPTDLTVVRKYLIAERRIPIQGEVVSKTGRTTGETQGSVVSNCANVSSATSGIVRLCQGFVARISPETRPIVGGGDSGSPVFTILDKTRVEASGILWGGDAAGSSLVFSRIDLTEAELGRMRICFNGCASDP